MVSTHYDALQINPHAPGTEIRSAYRALVRRYHPDLHPANEQSLRLVIEAYDVLSDPERRRRYDQELSAGGPTPVDHSSPRQPSRGNMRERGRTVDVGVVVAPQTFSQLGILVLDGSGSMAEPSAGKISKAQAVNGAVREMLTRFSVSRHKRNFSFAVVTFDESATVHTRVTAAADIDDNADYDPIRDHGGGTNIGAGLRQAQRIAEDFLRTAPQDIPSSVVIIVMSDGADGNAPETMRVAEEVKRNPAVTICTTFFAEVGSPNPEAQDHLRAMASYPATGFKTVYDAETLRKFFIASVSAGTNLVIA